MIKIFLRNASPEIELAVLNKVHSLIAESNGWIESTRANEKIVLGGSYNGKP